MTQKVSSPLKQLITTEYMEITRKSCKPVVSLVLLSEVAVCVSV